jgi:hypothetical protein
LFQLPISPLLDIANSEIIRYSSLNTRWIVMDVRNLQLPDASVDVAIDKGTLDVMAHGSLCRYWGRSYFLILDSFLTFSKYNVSNLLKLANYYVT